MKNYLKKSKRSLKKTEFINKFLSLLKKYKVGTDNICINIGFSNNFDIKIKKLDFDLDYKKDILSKINLSQHNLSLKFENITFKGKVSFKDVKLDKLEFKDVTFQENVGIKNLQLNTLILRPYKIDAHIVVNIGSYAQSGVVLGKKQYYINHIYFEDPHICNGKIYFIGITKSTKADFTNRNLENVIFQNCDFENTFFLNSFLKESKFLNCKFPVIKNENDKLFVGYENLFPFIFYTVPFIFFVEYLLFDYFDNIQINLKQWVNEEILQIVNYIYLPLTLPITLIILIYLFFILIESFINKIHDKNLINKHYCIADEKNINEKVLSECECEKNRKKYNELYSRTLSNIESIYTDLKINFKDNGDEQKAGDFYYASNLSKIILFKNFVDTIILMGSYIINGFGERPLRSFVIIIFILLFAGSFQKTNYDYIATQATPAFLLQVEPLVENNSNIYVKYDYNSSFQKYMVFTNKDEIKNSLYAIGNRFRKLDKNNTIENCYIPKLKESIITRIYYATSHIVAPFMQENRRWFENVGSTAYEISIIVSILLWLFLAGMMKAIFNRMKR